ncbi:serine hydrolase FSH [Mariannaea sp. PMI_226]|nr:serine hydrolase FSH [Mariannaea sp. PMI_226]
MKILCLHGRGSNSEIFQAQTASLRSCLDDDFDFEFVQGTELHTEGNWSVYTSQFSNLPQYTYYNPLVPLSVLDAEAQLLDLIEQEGGFDGVLGYSGGAGFAAQAMIRHSQEDPTAEPLFRFAIFINGATPLKTFALRDEKIVEVAKGSTPFDKELEAVYLRPSNLRVRKGDGRDAAEAAIASRKREINAVRTGQLMDGRYFLTDGEVGLTRYEGELDGPLIDVPTLHVRCPDEEDPNQGLNLLGLCKPGLVVEHHHQFGHDFPRGQSEMRKIAQLVTDMAEFA